MSNARIAELENEIAKLNEQLNRAIKDAARYRWMRDVGDVTWAPFSKRCPESVEAIDAAIDAAIAKSS